MVQEQSDRRPKYQQVAESLRQQVASLPAGARLPKMEELAAQYGVARLTVRSAILSLVREDLLTTIQGNGTFVGKVETPQAKPRQRVFVKEAEPEIKDEDVVHHLGLYFYSQNRIAEDAFQKNPDEENRRRMELAHTKSATYNILIQATQGLIAPEIPPLPNTAGLLVPILRQTFAEELKEIEEAKI